MTTHTHRVWRSGLADLASLARRLGHALIMSARADRNRAAVLAQTHGWPQGLAVGMDACALHTGMLIDVWLTNTPAACTTTLPVADPVRPTPS